MLKTLDWRRWVKFFEPPLEDGAHRLHLFASLSLLSVKFKIMLHIQNQLNWQVRLRCLACEEQTVWHLLTERLSRDVLKLEIQACYFRSGFLKCGRKEFTRSCNSSDLICCAVNLAHTVAAAKYRAHTRQRAFYYSIHMLILASIHRSLIHF